MIGRIRLKQKQNFDSSYIIILCEKHSLDTKILTKLSLNVIVVSLSPRNLTRLSILIASPWKRLPFTAENRSSAIIPEIAFSKSLSAHQHHDYISLLELPHLFRGDDGDELTEGRMVIMFLSFWFPQTGKILVCAFALFAFFALFALFALFAILPFCPFALLPFWNKGKGKRAKGQKGQKGQIGQKHKLIECLALFLFVLIGI